MKYSVFTAMMKDISPKKTVEKIKAFNYNGIEWGIDDDYSIKFKEGIRNAKYYRQITEDAGLEVSGLSTGVEINNLGKIKLVLEAAKKIGAPIVRVIVPWYGFEWEVIKKNNYWKLYNHTKENMRSAEKIAIEYGVKIVIETHFGNITPSAGLGYNLIKDFNPEYIGIIYDPGNMIIEGKESWKMGIEVLGKYLAHVHVKNIMWRYTDRDFQNKKCKLDWHWNWANMDKGMVNWQEVICALKLNNYKGYLSLEDFSLEPLEKRLEAIKYLKRLERDIE